jgi:hypothetical protein
LLVTSKSGGIREVKVMWLAETSSPRNRLPMPLGALTGCGGPETTTVKSLFWLVINALRYVHGQKKSSIGAQPFWGFPV